MKKQSINFGEELKRLRIAADLSLREICKLVDYDASNWSKIERGILSPPTAVEVLASWAKHLGLQKGSDEFERFIDAAQIAQGIIPADIMKNANAMRQLPAFFRTVRNGKPTKEDIDNLINSINRA